MKLGAFPYQQFMWGSPPLEAKIKNDLVRGGVPSIIAAVIVGIVVLALDGDLMLGSRSPSTPEDRDSAPSCCNGVSRSTASVGSACCTGNYPRTALRPPSMPATDSRSNRWAGTWTCGSSSAPRAASMPTTASACSRSGSTDHHPAA